MGAFEYQALDVKGRTRKGVAEADTPRQIRQQLREDGLTPLSVVSVKEPSKGSNTKRDGFSKVAVSRSKINTTELAVITRQFATLLGSDLTIEDSLQALIQQSEGHQNKAILTGVRSMVLEGRSLADSFRHYPRSFSELYTATIAAGEQTGRLAEVMERLADYTEARQSIQQRIGVALVYPIILIVVSILIVVALLTFVVPQVVQVFEDSGQELPLLTRILISISEFTQANGIIILGVLVAGAIAFRYIFRQPTPQYYLHRTFLRTAGLKKLVRSLNTARMARTLAIMVGSGVPLLSSISASADVIRNRVMRKSLNIAGDEVREGASFSRALRRSKQFPPLLVQMVASGESSGKLDSMLDKAALALERELEARIAVLVGLFEPIMILVMGCIVLTIVMAILMPIFDLNQLLG